MSTPNDEKGQTYIKTNNLSDDALTERGASDTNRPPQASQRNTTERYKQLCARLKSALESSRQEVKDKNARVTELEQQLQQLSNSRLVQDTEAGDDDTKSGNTPLGFFDIEILRSISAGEPENNKTIDINVLCRIDISVKSLQAALKTKDSCEPTDSFAIELSDEEDDCPDQHTWCFATLAMHHNIENNSTESERAHILTYGWVREADLVGSAPFQIELPPATPSKEEVDEIVSQLQSTRKKLSVAQEEYRRYRVKAETLVRQKDEEIHNAREEALATARADLLSSTSRAMPREFNSITEPQPTRDQLNEMDRETLQLRVKELQRALQSAHDEAAAWRLRCEDAESSSYQQGSNVERSTQQSASSWLSSLASVATGRQDTQTEITNESTNDLNDSRSRAMKSGVEIQLEMLRKEYDRYRKRSVAMLTDKEDALQLAQDEAEKSNRIANESKLRISKLEDIVIQLRRKNKQLQIAPPSAADKIHALRATSASENSTSALEYNGISFRASDSMNGHVSERNTTTATGLSPADHQYLTNIVRRYFSADNEQVRRQMQLAIATVLQFPPSELRELQMQQSTSDSTDFAASLWSSAASFFGNVSSSPVPAATGQNHRETGARHELSSRNIAPSVRRGEVDTSQGSPEHDGRTPRQHNSLGPSVLNLKF